MGSNKKKRNYNIKRVFMNGIAYDCKEYESDKESSQDSDNDYNEGF